MLLRSFRAAGPVAQARSASGDGRQAEYDSLGAVLVAEFLRPNGSRGPKPPAAEARNSTLLLGPAGFSPSSRVAQPLIHRPHSFPVYSERQRN